MEKAKTMKSAKAPEGQSLRSQLRTWLKEICPKQNVEDYCQIMADSATPEIMKVRVYTHDYRYSIYATGRPDEPEMLKRGLLSCDATRRKSLAGLTEHTYAHLVNGQFTRVTWELIKAAILRFELVKIVGTAKDDQWRKMCSHVKEGGVECYVEWLQKGDEIRDHKIYQLSSKTSDPIPKDKEK